MTSAENGDRVQHLLQRAQSAQHRENNQEAANAVREALTLDPSNEAARTLFETLDLGNGNVNNVLQLCQDYCTGSIEWNRFDASVRDANVEVAGMREALDFAFEQGNSHGDLIVVSILKTLNGRRALTPLLLDEPTRTFRALWSLGSESMKALIQNALLQPASWDNEDDRRKAEQEVFMLLLAKLLEPGLENPEMAMLSIARLVTVDAENLRDVIDSDTYRILFNVLDFSQTTPVRSQATVTLAKLRENDHERWESELLKFVDTMAQAQRTDNLITAFSAVTALFPVAPSLCAKMFLREGFVQQMVHLVARNNTSRFEEAALELCSAACIDGACRQAIQTHCLGWLADRSVERVGQNSSDRNVVAAALVMSKIKDGDRDTNVKDKLVGMLKRVVLSHDATETVIEKAIEGLQYQSINPSVKEDLCNDDDFLKRLILLLSDPKFVGNAPLIYVGMNIFKNLTQYPTILSPEQQKIAELKAYANKTPLPQTHPLDRDDPVSNRCTKVLAAGIAPLIVKVVRKASVSLQSIISSIIASISKHPRHRGHMAQNGLFDTAFALAMQDLPNSETKVMTKRQSALAVARIMIPFDPNVLLKGRNKNVEDVIKVLTFLIDVQASGGDDDQSLAWWRGYPTVYAVQALTNLATYQSSSGDPSFAANRILESCFDKLEDLWTEASIAVRTAVTECFVNLSLVDAGAAKFITDKRAKVRMQILAGYWSEPGALAEAAGGAIATLLGADERAVELFVDTKSGLATTIDRLQDGNQAMVHRAVVILAESLGSGKCSDRVKGVATKMNLQTKLEGLRGKLGKSASGEQIEDCLRLISK